MTRLFKDRGVINPASLLAGALVGLIALTGMYLVPQGEDNKSVITLESEVYNHLVGEDVIVNVWVASDVPVNTFAGHLKFNQEVLRVKGIDYNTSIADLWAELPWYNKGDGTIEFVGGTTRSGGFVGDDKLLTVTFIAMAPGNADLELINTKILKHDGLGTEADLTKTVNSIFVVNDVPGEVVEHDTAKKAEVFVFEQKPNTDLNNDGLIDLTDVSLFFVYLSTFNSKGDFNADGKVNATDLSIILNSRLR